MTTRFALALPLLACQGVTFLPAASATPEPEPPAPVAVVERGEEDAGAPKAADPCAKLVCPAPARCEAHPDGTARCNR